MDTHLLFSILSEKKRIEQEIDKFLNVDDALIYQYNILEDKYPGVSHEIVKKRLTELMEYVKKRGMEC